VPQSVFSAGQLATHVEAEQSGVPTGQAMPQPPQLAPSAAMFAQPVGQGVKPAWHVQAPLQICPGPHAMLQPPQLATSLAVLAHACPHAIKGGGQLHAEFAQVCVPPHTVPHAPQLFGSVVGLTHIDPQGAVPTAHSPDALPPVPRLPAVLVAPPTPFELPPSFFGPASSFAGGEQLIAAQSNATKPQPTDKRSPCARFMLFEPPVWN
jgi:hypothetical protein